MRWIATVVIILFVLTPLARVTQAAEESEPKATMNLIFRALTELLPLSLDEKRFADPAERTAILEWLDLLVESSDRLNAHAQRSDPGFQYLARALGSDVRQIRRRYGRGRYDEARFFLSNLTGACAACHSRLPAAREFPFSERMFSAVEVEALSPTELTRLQVATRQFDAALTTLEAAFADPLNLPARMDMDGELLDYLTIAIRVKQEPARARRTLEGLKARDDTSHYLRRNLDSWIASLRQIEKEGDSAPTLGQARSLIVRAQQVNEFPSDQEGLVYNLKASSVLHRFIDGSVASDRELAEAYYLLGVADAASRRSYWMSQAEFFLEAAIRSDPGSPVAEKAYALLEEYTVLGYSGSEGVHIPVDVQLALDDLRALIDAQKQAAANPSPEEI